MKKISNVAEIFEISTKLCRKDRRMAVFNGEIVRILDTGCGGFALYLIREDVDMKLFEDTTANLTTAGEVIFWHYWGYEGTFQTVYNIQKMAVSDFNEKCRKEINLIAEHNPKELKSLYELLKDGEMKEYVKEVKEELLKVLDF